MPGVVFLLRTFIFVEIPLLAMRAQFLIGLGALFATKRSQHINPVSPYEPYLRTVFIFVVRFVSQIGGLVSYSVFISRCFVDLLLNDIAALITNNKLD